MTKHEIGTVDDFPQNRGTPVEVSGVKIAVFNIDGEIHAVQDNCPHKNLPLHQIGIKKYRSEAGRNVFYDTEETSSKTEVDTRGRIKEVGDDVLIECPWHSLEFDINTGACMVRNDGIATYDITVDDDTVSIEL